MGDRGRSKDRRHTPRLRSLTPPARPAAAAEPARSIAFSQQNLQLLLATFPDLLKLVEVERLLIAHNRATSAIRRGDMPPLSVLKGLLAPFKYAQHHLGSVVRYVVLDGEDHLQLEAGEPIGEQTIALHSMSGRNLVADEEWEGCGREEVARLQDSYVQRHRRGPLLVQAAAAALGRSAALEWFARHRADEDGLAPHLPMLIGVMRDKGELQRWASRFELEPAGARAAIRKQPADDRQQVERELEERRRAEQERKERQQREEREREERRRQDERARRERQQREERERQERRQREERVRKERQAAEEREQQERRKREQLQAGRREQQQDAARHRPSSGEAAAGGALTRAGSVGSTGTDDAHDELLPITAALPPALTHHQQQQHPAALAAARFQAGQAAMALQAAGSGLGLPLPPHLLEGSALPSAGLAEAASAASPVPFIPLAGAAGRSSTPASFIPLEFAAGRATQHPPARPSTRLAGGAQQAAAPMHASGRLVRHPQHGAQSPAISANAEVLAAREAALGAAHRPRDSMPATAASARRSAQAPEPAAAGAGGKRKRASIQWEAQPQEEGDAPLLPLTTNPPAAPAAKAGAKASGKACAKGAAATEAGTKGAQAAKQPKADIAAAQGKAKAPKNFSITLHNAVAPEDTSPAASEEGEVRPPKQPRHESGRSGGPGPSRLGSGPAGLADASPHAATAPAFYQQQQQGYAAYPSGDAMGNLGFQASAGDGTYGDTPAYPPGFGGGAAHNGASLPGGVANLSVRVVMPGTEYAAATSGGQYQQYPQHHQLLANPSGYLLPADAAALQQQMGAAAGMYASMLASGQGVVDEFGEHRYVPTAGAGAAPLAPSPADVFLSGVALEQQQFGSGGYGGDLPAVAGGGMLGHPASPGPHTAGEGSHRSRASWDGGSGRVIEVERGGGGSGSGRASSRQGRGGQGGGQLSGDACWDPTVAWEARLLELLYKKPHGISVEELHHTHPLPKCLGGQDWESLLKCVSARKQLCRVIKSQQGRHGNMVQPVSGANDWLKYKRALLQLLADRRPRLEADIVQRQVAMPSRLPGAVRNEAQHNFVTFCQKYLRDEVAVVPGPDGSRLLELRPFSADAGGPGFPRLNPPFNKACSHRPCSFGSQCYYSHCPSRPYA